MANPKGNTLIDAENFLKIRPEISAFYNGSAGQNLSKLEPERLGIIYESVLSGEKTLAKKNKEGIFYTAVELVDFIVREAFDQIKAGTLQHRKLKEGTLRILDPAAGSGIFALRVLEYLAITQNKISFNQLENIYCCDKDNNALELARLSICMKLMDLHREGKFDFEKDRINVFFNRNFICRDSLLDNIPAAGNFDMILGNPPYGLSRGEKISKEENERLKIIYQDYLCGKPEKYLLFMAKSFELLGSKGILSFIVPNSWLAINGAKKIRQLLLQDCSLKKITVVDYQAFKTAGIETVIFTAVKDTGSDTLRLQRINNQIQVTSASNIPYKSLKKSAAFLIPTHWDENAESLLEKIFQKSFLLDSERSPFKPMIALQAYLEGKGTPPQTKENVKNHIFHFNHKHDETCYPYLAGSDIARFKLNWSGQYLRHGNWLAEYQPLIRYSTPRVLIREILREAPNCLVACYTDEVFFYNKSVLHIIPRNLGGTEIPLAPQIILQMKLLSALLNSRLYSLIISLRGIKSQRRLFPKVLNEDLKNLPVPVSILNGGWGELSNIDSYLCEDGCNQVAKLLFDLSVDDMNVINDSLSQLPWVDRRRLAC